METTGVNLAYDDVKDEVEQHLQSCDALMENMDGWENEKKQNSRLPMKQVKEERYNPNQNTIYTFFFFETRQAKFVCLTDDNNVGFFKCADEA